MKIENITDFRNYENQINAAFRQYKLDHILLGIKFAKSKLEPFVIAGMALFAFRNCTAGLKYQQVKYLEWDHVSYLAHLVTQYLLADPLTFDKSILKRFQNSNPVFAMLRIVGNQFPYNVNLFGQYARPMILFNDLPKQLAGRPSIPSFDFEDSFFKITGFSIADFVKVGFLAYIAAEFSKAFTRGYFEKARSQGIKVPHDTEILPIIEQLSTDPNKYIRTYRKYMENDRSFAMYDFNPLFLYPIVRPWRQNKFVSMDQDRMLAPIPNLIAERISIGIFYQMFNHYKTDFSKYFGHVFEAYVGCILKESNFSSALLSEEDIRRKYNDQKGKVPDWAIIDGATTILIECKATRFSRAATTLGTEEAISDSLKQVIKGLEQLHDFKIACETKVKGLELFHSSNEFIPVLITLEPLHMINSILFKEFINQKLAKKGKTSFSWRILSIGELETLQAHLAVGVSFSEIVRKLDARTFYDILKEIISLTGKTYKDSFLYKTNQKMYRLLGVPDKTAEPAACS